MYRIKTDIRQYKCESKDKVEKLIRNWVIRPNDLIYHSDKQAWSPIGEHPSFIKLFGMLDEQERNEPDTVVTTNPTRAPATQLGDADSEEVTNVKPRPVFEDEEETDERIEVAEDIRKTDIIDQDDVASSMNDGPLAPPEAPEGVEPPVQSEEVTMMTEKTLDLLTITDEDEAVEREEEDDSEPRPSPTVIVDESADEEVTDVRDRDEVAEESQEEVTEIRDRDDVTEESEEEVTEIRDRDDVTEDSEEEPSDDSDAESTEEEPEEESEPVEETAEEDEISEPEADEPGEEESDESEGEDSEPDDETVADEMAAASVQDSTLSTSKPRGRHNLPEEFFATNEISAPVDRDAPVIDDLGELPEGSDDEEESVDDGWDDMAEDLRSTAELDPAEVEASVSADRKEPEDDAQEEYEEDEWDEYENELDAGEVAAELFGPKGDRVADPYAIPLPFEIKPEDSDIKVGLKESARSRSVKERSFPYPSAKERGRVYTKKFDLTPPPPVDKTAALIFAVIFVFVLLFALVYWIF